MATIGNQALTLADWVQGVDPDGKIAMVIDLLSQTNEMLDDMLYMEGNLTTGYRTSIRTGLPQGTWRKLYQGVQPSKSTKAQVEERCGNLEAYSEIDKDLADLNGNTQEFRLSEDAAFFEGMTQQMQGAYLYSSQLGTPEQITGLSPRYNTVNTATALTAANTIDMGGTGSTNTSIWFVQWGANTCFGMFPRGKMAGLMHEDLGRATAIGTPFQASPGAGYYEVYRSHFKWETGLCVRDWRYIVRLANIDVTLLNGVNAANLINGLVRGINRWPTAPRDQTIVQTATRPSGLVGGGRGAIYISRTIATYLRLQAMNKTNLLLRLDEWDGKVITTFSGVPLRIVDQLLSTEARLT
jgi:hypothetical protein